MHDLPEASGSELSPDDIEMLQRVFDATCFAAHVPRRGESANRLAKFIMDEFRIGNSNERTLLERALWRELRRMPSKTEEMETVDIWVARPARRSPHHR
ncbi:MULTISPECIES: hypothetical protein [unclassified Ensifer]|uniref:hypothetical protein n=1 Tax=unclassified Ensifer TaxID=2633371 RepID=UPI000813814B|nr:MULTISPECIES: hypothetical protein [unclassified Ensifer]OCP23146.1 hypothetical protein BC361_23280 [Ensifer sp. LC54]OCP24974.1 hypothetical protein BC363_21460 [Ensifer sp. LC384]OCP38602.1 hypothetical protein BC360_00570 [Ensifer sp. LC163]